MMYACFYANDEPLSLAIREETRRPGQPWEQVPSHCAALFARPDGSEWVYEFVVTGFNCRRAHARDAWRVPITLSADNELTAYTFAANSQGKYDWDAVFGWLVNDHLPPGLRVCDTFPTHKDCSRYLCAVLLAGGLALPPALVEDCPSPNDVLYALRAMSPIGDTVSHG